MSTLAVRKAPPITVEQYEAFEGYPGLRDELIDGEIVLSPQPKPFHQQVAKNIERLLEQTLKGQPYIVQQNSNIKFRLAHSLPAPDVFVALLEDWKNACESDEYLNKPPTLVVEVTSAANRKAKIARKIEIYLDNDVHAVWVVSPKKRSLQVHRNVRQRESREFTEQDTVVLPEPLAGEVLLRDIFLIG